MAKHAIHGESEGGKPTGGSPLPSLKLVAAGFTLVALVVALGMTGGQVRELADRVTAVEGEREAFERRVDKLRADNKELIGQLRDYQAQIEMVQSSNIALSKRVVNREMAVEDLQVSLDSILKEKYATENAMRDEIAKLEDLKRDLSAQVAALGEAVAAQSQEIAQLDVAYRDAQEQLDASGDRNEILLSENNRYLDLLNQMQDDLDAVQAEGEVMAERFALLQSESAAVEAEKLALERELELIKTVPVVDPIGVDSFGDPFEGRDPFGFEPVDPTGSPYAGEPDDVASVFEPRST